MMINLKGRERGWKKEREWETTLSCEISTSTVAVVTNAYAVSCVRQNEEEKSEWVPDSVHYYRQEGAICTRHEKVKLELRQKWKHNEEKLLPH